MSAVRRALLILVLVAGGTGSAWAYFEISGTFVPDDQCEAVVSIKKQTNPGGVLTMPGRAYNARALNKEGGDHVHLDVPEADPKLRWVHVDCGDLELAGSGTGPTGDGGSGALVPFFDSADGAGDPSPAAPTLSGFDRAVLELCGDWGSHPRRTGFRMLLGDPGHADTIAQIRSALGGTVLGTGSFEDELTEIWFKEDGFAHIFCGEPSAGNLGGLHFAGRYLEMQLEGWGGLATSCNKQEIEPPIYTLGVRYRKPDGGFRNACPKGYPLNLDAAEILIEVTRAFKLIAPRVSGKEMCLHEVSEAGDSYLAVFVIKNGAVRTFYPDASPRCEGGGTTSCRCAQ